MDVACRIGEQVPGQPVRIGIGPIDCFFKLVEGRGARHGSEGFHLHGRRGVGHVGQQRGSDEETALRRSAVYQARAQNLYVTNVAFVAAFAITAGLGIFQAEYNFVPEKSFTQAQPAF